MSTPKITASEHESVDETAFRQACGHFPTGVAIVTALDIEGRPIGLTSNSFTSAALSPPMVLWTIGPKSRSFDSFARARFYAVHILRDEQKEIAAHFAGRSDDKFRDLEWQAGTQGLPILPDFSVCMECAVEDVHPCGNQRLMIGRVVNIRQNESTGSLFYFHSTFGALDRPVTDQ
ncbi:MULTISPECIES: flavin reductase family protein [unclassified Ruegeria]|uniref:flavin reductase family protein n=1 Tax=unclassified Ruegeria TaxID=2625375 RepID=UPI001488DB8D|nr:MULTISPECIES: flavin reductase family protein [unclassified Ruegeria]NOD77561.1 flavin reductase [Ruegeria sp. HKCCD4332]NOD89766.1 flavin reductase [Ruegeria sp. HKCCD4318]NOD94458.1 flavin reductase [Ruegeria sp. HKCCD4884]NOE14788.1 flavin reductase [Ruegeria sp. HKCCD4318-2]NOG11610.1 flavin reductase family protein [Ruegeria sp. HKCCD4315]